MKAKLKLFVVAAVTMLTTTATYAANQSMMELLRILRDKGTLTQNEYELLVNASKADKERVEVIKNDTMGAVSKQLKKAKNAESWATKVKVKGDIRLRYQYQDTDGGNARSRGRYRARIGIIG